MALITDCPKIIIHAEKHYKALIDSGAAISLIRYSTCQSIDSNLKTPIQATTTKLNMADGSPMTALAMTALHLSIADFKFTHTFIVCNRLPDKVILFGIDIQKKYSLSYAWDMEKNCYIQKDGKFLTSTRNCEQKVTIGIVKSTLKITHRHNGVIPIKIKGHTIKGHMAYFINNQDSTKGKDPNINIINGIHNINGKTSVNILVSNYTNKHITFSKGEYVGHLELTIKEISNTAENPDAPTMHSITTEKMSLEEVEMDAFKPPHHKLKQHIETRLTGLLKEYDSQLAQDETSIGSTPLTEMTIDTGASEPVSQKPYLIVMKHYQWIKDEINKLLLAKVIKGHLSSWSAPIIMVPKGDGGKCLVTDYCTLGKVTRKFIWPTPKVKDIFSQLNRAKYFSTLDL